MGSFIYSISISVLRIMVVDGGNLKFLESHPSDSGVYRCIASNVAGERLSHPATLLVLRRPHFLVKPNNITALIGQNIEFYCQVSRLNLFYNVSTKSLILLCKLNY